MRYKTVVIDPPWSIKLSDDLEGKIQGSKLPAVLDYETMTNEELLNFPIDDYAADDCLLFLWATNSKLENGRPCLWLALEMLERWGFNYRLVLVWVKPSGFAVWSPFRGNTEFVIFATRGTFNVPPYGRFSNVFYAPITKHSEKPARFYQLLRGWTPKPRIDIFARRAHDGFDGWGNEYAGNSDEGTLLEYLEK